MDFLSLLRIHWIQVQQLQSRTIAEAVRPRPLPVRAGRGAEAQRRVTVVRRPQARRRPRAGAARRDVPGARRRGAARRGGLAPEGRRHRRQGPGQVRLLLGLQHGESTLVPLPSAPSVVT